MGEPATPLHARPAATAPAGFGWVGDLARAMVPLLRPHRATLGLIGLLMVIEMGLQLGQRKAFSTLLDEAILKSQAGLMVMILGLLVAAAVLSGAAGMLHEYLQARLCASVPGEVRARLFAHTQTLPLSQLRTSTHGDVITRITTDAGSVEPALWSIGYIAAASCGVLISFVLLLWTDWRLALAGIALMPLALIGPRLLTPRAARESYAAKTGVGALATHLQENLANQIVLRVFGLAGLAHDRFARHNERIITASKRYNIFSYFSHRVPWIAIELIELVMLALGCWRVLRGEMTPGELVAFYLLFAGLATHTYTLTTSIPGLINASAGMRRVGELLDLPAESRHGALPMSTVAAAVSPQRQPPTLRLDAVTFRHASRGDGGIGASRTAQGDSEASSRRENDRTPGDSEAAQLRDVSITARAGEMTAFVGASGSGKSTALQLLLGLQRPLSGRVLVDDADLAGLALDDYWSGVSAVFQDSLLFHTSIGENIRAGRLGATDAQVEASAAAAGIADWVQTLPERYDTMVSGDTCSGGQRQRIALARALIREPRLLVLDEPTSALDPSTGSAVMQTLRRVSAGRTTILVTHQLRDAAVAQQIVVFERGRIVESGTHAALLDARGAYAGLWAEQQGDRPAP